MLITLAFISCHKIDLPKPENQYFSSTKAEDWWNTVFVGSKEYNSLDENSLYAQPSRRMFSRKAGQNADSISIIGSIKKLNWKNATSYKVSNLEAVEVPMVYDGNPFIFPSDSSLDFATKKRMANAAMHKLVLLKLPSGKVNLRIVSVIPTKNLNKPWRGNVNKVGKDFTGWMIVRQWNEKERAVWYFENGKRIKQYKSVKLNPKGAKRKSQGSWPGQCTPKPVTQVMEICTPFCSLPSSYPQCLEDPYADSNPDECRVEELIVGYEYDCNDDGNYDDCDNNGQCYCSMLSGFCDDNDDGQGGGGGGGGGGGTLNTVVVSLSNVLNLSDIEIDWLNRNIQRAEEILNYINTTNNLSYLTICQEHIKQMMNDTNYLNFVINHSNTGNGTLVWWEDETWIDNPINFNINIDSDDDFQNTYNKLTFSEKQLVNKYPIEAYFINKNASIARNETIQIFGPDGLNNKADAFRHAYFNAMNRRDCGLDHQTLENIAKLFSDAHESDTPPQLIKEKQMDLWNNNIGHLLGDVFFPILTFDNYFVDEIMKKLQDGELRYLKPLKEPPFFPNGQPNPNGDPNFYGLGGIHDISTATHGITNLTQLTPTNQ